MEPLRAMSTGAPLEDARHLAQRYSRMRQEAEAQVLKCTRVLSLCCGSDIFGAFEYFIIMYNLISHLLPLYL